MLNFKGMRFPIDAILVCIRWYAADPLRYGHLEEIMKARGVSVDHSTINSRMQLKVKPRRRTGASAGRLSNSQSIPGVWRSARACVRMASEGSTATASSCKAS